MTKFEIDREHISNITGLVLEELKKIVANYFIAGTLVIVVNSIYWTFQLTTYFDKTNNYSIETRRIATEANAKVDSVRNSMYSFGLIQSGHTIEIEHLKKQ